MSESFWDYLMRVTRSAPGADIARVVGMDAGTVSRWKTGKARPSLEAAVVIAQQWSRNPVEVLIAAGHLNPAAAGAAVVEVGRGINEISDDELLAEIRRRMEGLRNALEAAEKSSASAKGVKGQEAKLRHKPESFGAGSLWSNEDAGVRGDEDGEHGHHLPGS